MVAKLADLDMLRHEASIYQRIADRGGVSGVPTLIGLYVIGSSTYGVLMQSDCGDPLVKNKAIGGDQKYGLLITTFNLLLTLGLQADIF